MDLPSLPIALHHFLGASHFGQRDLWPLFADTSAGDLCFKDATAWLYGMHYTVYETPQEKAFYLQVWPDANSFGKVVQIKWLGENWNYELLWRGTVS